MRRSPFFTLFVVLCCATGAGIGTAQDLIDVSMEAMRRGEYDTAIATLGEIVRRRPDNELAYALRVKCWQHKGDFDKAIADLTEALRINSSHPRYYIERGNAWVGRKLYEKAIADYDEAIRLAPSDEHAYFLRGQARAGWGHFDKAIADYTEALRIRPTVEAYMCRSSIWEKKQDYAKALQDLNAARELESAMKYRTIDDRGRAPKSYACGDYGSELADITEALRQSPNDAGRFRSLAWFLATCPHAKYRDGAKAVENGARAVEMDPTNHCFCDTLAAAYAEVGDFNRAEAWQEKAIELASTEEDKNAYRRRLELYSRRQPYRDVPGLR